MALKVKRAQVTMSDIAKLASVSRPVVYTVLNNREGKGIHVGQKTKENILKIAQEVGYVIPKSAKELYSGISDRIAFLAQTLCPQTAELLECIQQKAFQRKIDIMPLITMGDPEREKQYLNLMLDGRVDGVIAVSETGGSIERFKEFASAPKNLRIVYIDGFHDGLSCIQNDKEQVAKIAVEQFVAEGRKKLVFAAAYQYTEQEKYCLQYAVRAGMDVKKVYFENLHTAEKISAKTSEVLSYNSDAVFASNDLSAVAIVNKAIQKGIKIPEQLSVIGVGDIEVAKYSSPALSTVKIDFDEIAKKALQIMHSKVKENNSEENHYLIKSKIVLRGTTK